MAKVHHTWTGSLTGSSTPIEMGRIWIDGCFDTMHVGHARLLLTSQSIGTTTVVGVHSDDEVQAVKGPVVMPLKERVLLVAACRWVSEVVPCALPHTGPMGRPLRASVAVHGDDIPLDENDQDNLAEMRAADRYHLIQRARGPGAFSTTNLIDRILHTQTGHHLPRNIITKVKLKVNSGEALDESNLAVSNLLDKINLFSAQNNSKNPTAVFELSKNVNSYAVSEIVKGCSPSAGQRIVYADGAFDLFTAGHVAFLETIISNKKRQQAILEPYLIVGIYDDETVSQYKGADSPVMNMVERALMLLQTRYVSAVILSAPLKPTLSIFSLLYPPGITAVYFGAVTFGMSPHKHERYAELENRGMLVEVERHPYQNITAETIRHRVMEQREAFELRQRAKCKEQKDDE